MVNETINATADYLTVLHVKERFFELVSAPYNHSDLLWITIPLVIALLFMTIYFGVPGYRYEIKPLFEVGEALKMIGMG